MSTFSISNIFYGSPYQLSLFFRANRSLAFEKNVSRPDKLVLKNTHKALTQFLVAKYLKNCSEFNVKRCSKALHNSIETVWLGIVPVFFCSENYDGSGNFWIRLPATPELIFPKIALLFS